MFRLFVALSLVAVLAMPAMAGTFPALSGVTDPVAGATDEQASITYDPSDGSVGVNAPASTMLTSVNIDSAALGFNVANVDMTVFDGSFDTVTANNMFKATFGGNFGSTSFGVGVMASGLSCSAVVADLTAVGSLDGGGDLGAVDLLCSEGTPEPPPEGGIGDEQTSLVYNPGTGSLSVDAPASTELSSINVNSAGSLFVVGNFDMANFDGSFDTATAGNFFKATFGGSFGSFVVGEGVMPAGLSPDQVIADLGIGAAEGVAPTGSLDGGGGLGDVDLVYIPEPSALILLSLGVLGLAIRRRR